MHRQRVLSLAVLVALFSYTAPINLGPRVNSTATEQFASLSHDGRYFFFSSDRNGNFEVYWIDAAFIEDLRNEAGASAK